MKKKLKNSSNTADCVRIDPADPDPDVIQRAVALLRHSGVLVFPTTGLYGLGADAFATQAVDRVFHIKRRPAGMPLLVMVAGRHAMGQVVKHVPDYAQRLLGLWPGGVTLVFEAGNRVPPNLTGGTGKIGVRIPAHPVARALVETFGSPITATSANLSGRAAPDRVADLDPTIHVGVDLVLDAGQLAGGPGSTVLDVSRWPVRLIREGAVAWPSIDRMLSDA